MGKSYLGRGKGFKNSPTLQAGVNRKKESKRTKRKALSTQKMEKETPLRESKTIWLLT